MVTEPKKELEPKPTDEESKKILEEMAEEEKAKADAKTKEEADATAAEAAKGKKSDDDDDLEDGQDDDAGDDDEGEDGEEDGKKKPKRTPKLMPLFEHEIAKKNWEKDLSEKDKKILELTQQLQDKSKPDQMADIEKFVEKTGLDKETVTGLVDIISKQLPKPGAELDAETKKRLQAFEQSQVEQAEKQGFDKEFTDKVIPVLEKQGIPEDKRGRVKKLLEKMAFTTKFANTPLDVIFKGCEEFDPFREKGKPSGEASRGAPHIEGEEKGVMEKSDEEFDKWSDDMAKSQKSGYITRNGQRIR